VFISCNYVIITVVKCKILLFYRLNNKGVKMRKLSENEIKQVSGGDGNDGQAELIAIRAIAGTFLSPDIGSIAGA
ncbi:hypothetical protein L7H67_005194, partial [Klebsiella pneumoniae]